MIRSKSILFGSVTARFRHLRFERLNFLFLGFCVGKFVFNPRNSLISVHWVICNGPNPKERPDRMKSKKADPAAIMNGILVRMIPLFGNKIGDVVNRNHPVSQDQDCEDEEEECEPAQKVHGSPLEIYRVAEAKLQAGPDRKHVFAEAK